RAAGAPPSGDLRDDGGCGALRAGRSGARHASPARRRRRRRWAFPPARAGAAPPAPSWRGRDRGAVARHRLSPDRPLSGRQAGGGGGLMALPFFRKAVIAPPPDVEAASLRSDRFRLAREGDWRRLEAIVAALEKNRLRRISDEDVLALPVLYRKTASSLAVAREISLDSATLAYLESLLRRAWFQVYGPRTSLWGWFKRFLGGGWSASVRAIWLDLCIALAVMIAGT